MGISSSVDEYEYKEEKNKIISVYAEMDTEAPPELLNLVGDEWEVAFAVPSNKGQWIVYTCNMKTSDVTLLPKKEESPLKSFHRGDKVFMVLENSMILDEMKGDHLRVLNEMSKFRKDYEDDSKKIYQDHLFNEFKLMQNDSLATSKPNHLYFIENPIHVILFLFLVYVGHKKRWLSDVHSTRKSLMNLVTILTSTEYVPISIRGFFEISKQGVDYDWYKGNVVFDNNALDWSVANGSWDATHVMLDYVKDPSVIDHETSSSSNALHLACAKGYRTIKGHIVTGHLNYIYTEVHTLVDKMLKIGGDPNAVVKNENRDCNGWTPLHFACAHRNPDLIGVLLCCEKTRSDIKNADGKTPRDMFELSYEKVRDMCQNLVHVIVNEKSLFESDDMKNKALDAFSKGSEAQHLDPDNLYRCMAYF